MQTFLRGSFASSAVWSVYMLTVGMLLGPIVGGNPVLSLAAGVVMAVLTAGGFALVTRLRARRRRAAGVTADALRADAPAGVTLPVVVPST
jgi:membrane protein DedA with SNARE-associated domain